MTLSVYPPSEVKWTKKALRVPETDLVNGGRISIESRRVSVTELVSTLLIHKVEESDTAVYSCSVGGEKERLAAAWRTTFPRAKPSRTPCVFPAASAPW